MKFHIKSEKGGLKLRIIGEPELLVYHGQSSRNDNPFIDLQRCSIASYDD